MLNEVHFRYARVRITAIYHGGALVTLRRYTATQCTPVKMPQHMLNLVEFWHSLQTGSPRRINEHQRIVSSALQNGEETCSELILVE